MGEAGLHQNGGLQRPDAKDRRGAQGERRRNRDRAECGDRRARRSRRRAASRADRGGGHDRLQLPHDHGQLHGHGPLRLRQPHRDRDGLPAAGAGAHEQKRHLYPHSPRRRDLRRPRLLRRQRHQPDDVGRRPHQLVQHGQLFGERAAGEPYHYLVLGCDAA